MKQIINNKLYDTENSEIIYTFIKSVEYCKNIFTGTAMYQERKADVYKTKKRNYFLYIEKYDNDDTHHFFTPYIEEITEDEVKKIVADLNAEKYIEIFGMEGIEYA